MANAFVKRASTLLFGERALKRLSAKPIADWAKACLNAKADSPALRICAALTEDAPDAAVHLQQALNELGIVEPGSGDALGAYADQLATDLLERRCEAVHCAREIFAVTVALDYPRALRRWTHIDDMLTNLESGQMSYFDPELTPERFAEHVREAAGKLLRRDFHDERVFGEG